MAKLSSINKNNKRIKLSNKFYKKRTALKKIIMDKKLPLISFFSGKYSLTTFTICVMVKRTLNRAYTFPIFLQTKP